MKLMRFGIVAVAVGLPPLVLGNYWLFMASQVAVFAVATIGLDILYGRTGQLSLAHGALMGVGAYTTVVLANEGYGFGVQLAAVVLLALAVGALVAIPTLRLSGMRLALVTLAFGELFAWAVTRMGSLTGGSEGATVPIIAVGPLDSSRPVHGYVLAMTIALLVTLLAWHLGSTQLGRRMLAVRDSEFAASSVGVPIVSTKVTAFLISAVLAGLAGWLYAAIVGFVAPTDFDLFASVFLFVAVVVGGAGRVVGAWLGAAYIVLAPEIFSVLGAPNLYALVGGALLAVVALLAPDGIAGLAEGVRRRVTRSRRAEGVSR
jgi:branched-chain amino acid transport system permease protein